MAEGKQGSGKAIVILIVAMLGLGGLGYAFWPLPSQNSADNIGELELAAAPVVELTNPTDDASTEMADPITSSQAQADPIAPETVDPEMDATEPQALEVEGIEEPVATAEVEDTAAATAQNLLPDNATANPDAAAEEPTALSSEAEVIAPTPDEQVSDSDALPREAEVIAPTVDEQAAVAEAPQADPAPAVKSEAETPPAEPVEPTLGAQPVEPSLSDVAPQVLDTFAPTPLAGAEAASLTAPASVDAPAAPDLPVAGLGTPPVIEQLPEIPLTDADRVSGSASEGAPPRFDVVRVDRLGGVVVAGRATPGSTVTVRLAGVELAVVSVGANGQFVAIINAPASEAPQALQLESTLPEQETIAATEQIIVLPAPADAADATPALVRTTPEAVELVQPFIGDVSNVSLDSISYSTVGAVVLTGRAQPGTAIRAYADTDLLGETVVGATGQWRLDVPGLDAGIYILRIDEIDAEGKVTSRVESPFQRETPEAAAAQAQAMAAQAGGQVIVQPGNTLWLLATQAYGEGTLYTQIFSANSGSIRDPDLIYPGQVFAIPELP